MDREFNLPLINYSNEFNLDYDDVVNKLEDKNQIQKIKWNELPYAK
jgi:hypothetical protein